jgi:hypothetical protein
MQCDQCGQPLDMICLDCDSHLFQVTVSHNAKAWVKGRWKLLKKASAKYKELKQTVIFLRVGITITITIGLSLAGWVIQLIKSKGRGVDAPSPVISVIPFPAQMRLGPNEHLAGGFSLEGQRQNVTLSVSVKCQDCADGSLEMFVFDEEDYQKFERVQNYNPIRKFTYDNEFAFNGPLEEAFSGLEKGRYYVVFHNSSRGRTISAEVDLNMCFSRWR